MNSRREALKTIILGSAAVGIGSIDSAFAAIKPSVLPSKGKINHSVCRWTFGNVPLEELALACSEMGITAIDLLRPPEWRVVSKYGLECSMGTDKFAVIEHGFNDPQNHGKLQKDYKHLIDEASNHGVKKVICFSGNRRGLSDKLGIENCAAGLTPLLQHAAKRDVTLAMELLNSKVDHPDYQCDHTEWGVALAEKMGSSNFKLLYDIYHMQIMEGDIISTIRKYHPYINHYHTAGVPGRHEINDSQELNYLAIMRAIAGTGFDGFVAQEFIPTYENRFEALREAIRICDI